MFPDVVFHFFGLFSRFTWGYSQISQIQWQQNRTVVLWVLWILLYQPRITVGSVVNTIQIHGASDWREIIFLERRIILKWWNQCLHVLSFTHLPISVQLRICPTTSVHATWVICKHYLVHRNATEISCRHIFLIQWFCNQTINDTKLDRIKYLYAGETLHTWPELVFE